MELKARETELNDTKSEFMKVEAQLKKELMMEKEASERRLGEMEAKIAHGVSEIQRINVNLRASDTELGTVCLCLWKIVM